MSVRYKSAPAIPPRPKRYYKRLSHFPEDIDRLEAEVLAAAEARNDADGAPSTPIVTQEQIARWVDELFLDGGVKAVVGYIILKYGAWEQAMAVGRSSDDSKTEFRATWALEWAYEQAEEGDLPEWFFDRLVDDFCVSSNSSLHRIYAKMICDRMRFGGVHPTDGQAGLIAEKCFDLVIDPQTKTALKFWCLEILSELAPRIDWIADELPDTLRHLSEAHDCSPGMKVATREILKRLKQQ